jgi:lysophospholipase L1-like esterase
MRRATQTLAGTKTNLGVCVCDGDSITAGYGVADPSTQAWPALLAAQVPWSFVAHNVGISGQTVQQMIDDAADADAFLDPLAHWGPGRTDVRNLYICFGGHNDLSTIDSLAAMARIEDLIKRRRYAKHDTFVVGTILKAGTDPRFETQRRLLNAYIGRNAKRLGYTVCNVAADAALQDPTDGVHFQGDQTHPTDAGHVVIAAAFAATLTTVRRMKGPVYVPS